MMSQVRKEKRKRNIIFILTKLRLNFFEKEIKIRALKLIVYTGAYKLYTWAFNFGMSGGAQGPNGNPLV